MLITDTVPDDWFATNSRLPSGVIARPNGSVPTLMLSTTLRVRALITETVPLAMFATYTFSLSGVIATHQGSLPTGISSTFVLASAATLNTETELLSGLTLQTYVSSLVMAIGLERVADEARSLQAASSELSRMIGCG